MRSAVAQAKNQYNTASGTASKAGANADQIGSSLIPGLEREAASPQGYTPEEMNNMLVAGEQGAGGANSGIVGDASRRLARTRNSAGYSGALDAAARDKTQTLSQNALNVQNESANLGQEKQMNAQKQLQGLYGTDVSENLGAMGLGNEAINAEVNANKDNWFQNLNQAVNTAANAANAYANVKKANG